MAKNVIINSVVYSDVPHIEIPKEGGGTAKFFDPDDATATQTQILTGSTAYINGGKKTGSMANNGSTSGTINTKAGTVTIPSGYTTGGTVSISSEEQAKIIANNIKSGVTILGQAGGTNIIDSTISSDAATSSSIISGFKAYANGVLLIGTASMPTISQDSTTKILSIS